MTITRPQLANRLCTAATGFLLLAIAVQCSRIPWAMERELLAIRATGYGALGALFLALSTTPAIRLLRLLAPARTRAPALLPFRRSFGITSAVLALLHAGLSLATYLRPAWAAVPERAHLRAGLVALAIPAALLVTSFPRLVAGLRVRLWKQLHRLAYVAALFVFQHMMLSPFAPRATTLALFLALAAVSLLRLLPSRSKREPS